MDLRHLRYFVAVAEERSFSRAANRLNISQPPLSRQIQTLEADLGVTLFDRTSRQVELTSAGRVLLPRARDILFESATAEEETRRWASGYKETIRIGFMSAVMLAAFEKLLAAFHNEHPSVALKFVQMRSDDQFTALIDDRIDVGFVDFGIDKVRDRLANAKVAAQPFLRNELCAAVPLEHPLAERDEIHMAELKDETFAILERHLFPAHHDMVIAECTKAGFAPRIVHHGDQIPTVLTYVAARMAVCISPRIAESMWGNRIRFLSLVGRPHITINMIRRLDSSLQSVSDFSDFVVQMSNCEPAAL